MLLSLLLSDFFPFSSYCIANISNMLNFNYELRAHILNKKLWIVKMEIPKCNFDDLLEDILLKEFINDSEKSFHSKPPETMITQQRTFLSNNIICNYNQKSKDPK